LGSDGGKSEARGCCAGTAQLALLVDAREQLACAGAAGIFSQDGLCHRFGLGCGTLIHQLLGLIQRFPQLLLAEFDLLHQSSGSLCPVSLPARAQGLARCAQVLACKGRLGLFEFRSDDLVIARPERSATRQEYSDPHEDLCPAGISWSSPFPPFLPTLE
jgi:hypothetical protein